MKRDSYVDKYLVEAADITRRLDKTAIIKMIGVIAKVKKRSGRIFMLGVGGGAGNAGHAVNDFRKIANIEAYAPTDNVSELTARVNDDGWDSSYSRWLKVSKLNSKDCVFIFSVGGGNAGKKISNNLVRALKYAKRKGSKIIGIVGRDGGYTARVSDAVVMIPVVNAETITPHTEAYQALIWHLIVSHPLLKSNKMKWESVK